MNKKIKPFFYLPVFVLASCASKQDLNVVAYDVRKLKTESETIKSQTAVSYADVQQVRDDVLRLQGRLEEIAHKSGESAHSNENSFRRLGTQDSLLFHQVGDLDSRLLKIEQYLGLGKEAAQSPALLSGQKDSVAVNTASGTLTDAALLNGGMEKLKQNSYAAARESFSTLLRTWPKSDLTDDAQFFIAESYFNEKWYEKAIVEYQVVISKYAKSNKRPGALYKQARSFEILGDMTSAKTRYKDLVNTYPTSFEAGLAKKKLR